MLNPRYYPELRRAWVQCQAAVSAALAFDEWPPAEAAEHAGDVADFCLIALLRRFNGSETEGEFFEELAKLAQVPRTDADDGIE